MPFKNLIAYSTIALATVSAVEPNRRRTEVESFLVDTLENLDTETFLDVFEMIMEDYMTVTAEEIDLFGQETDQFFGEEVWGEDDTAGRRRLGQRKGKVNTATVDVDQYLRDGGEGSTQVTPEASVGSSSFQNMVDLQFEMAKDYAVDNDISETEFSSFHLRSQHMLKRFPRRWPLVWSFTKGSVIVRAEDCDNQQANPVVEEVAEATCPDGMELTSMCIPKEE